MGKHYERAFKIKIVKHYRDIQKWGETRVNGKTITTVQDLVKELGTTKDSLYKWEKSFTEEELNGNNKNGEIQSVLNDKITLKIEGIEQYADFFAGEDETIQSIEKQVNKLVREKLKVELRNRALSIRRLSEQARDLGVPNYSNMTVDQLKLAVGNELIKDSGLIRRTKL